MDKAQAIHNFWNRFLPAYDENTVDPDVEYPYITYNVKTDSLGSVLSLNASLWYHSESWEEITKKAEEIGEYIVKMYPPTIEIDTGRLYIAKGKPFSQRGDDPSDKKIRRILLNIQTEFLTAF